MKTLDKLTLNEITNGWNKFPSNTQNLLLQRYPLLRQMGHFDYNEIIISAKSSLVADIQFNGPDAKRFYYKFTPDEYERLYNNRAGSKFLIFNVQTGEFINETRNKNDAEGYLGKHRILVYRG